MLAHVQLNKTMDLYIYIDIFLDENVSENGCIYTYIRMSPCYFAIAHAH